MAATVLIAHGMTARLKQAVVDLQRGGFNVVATPDGGDAFARFFEVEPDLVICSQSLPSLSGANFAKMVCSQSPGTPVVVLLEPGAEVPVPEPVLHLPDPLEISALRELVPTVIPSQPGRASRSPGAWSDDAPSKPVSNVFVVAALKSFQRSNDILGCLDDSGLQRLAGLAVHQVCPPGDRVIAEGEVGDSCYFLVEGQVKVTLAEHDDAEVARINPGGFFGEMALLSDKARSASVWTVGEATLLRFSRSDFLPFLDIYPQIREVLSGVALKRTEENLWRALFDDGKVEETFADLASDLDIELEQEPSDGPPLHGESSMASGGAAGAGTATAAQSPRPIDGPAGTTERSPGESEPPGPTKPQEHAAASIPRATDGSEVYEDPTEPGTPMPPDWAAQARLERQRRTSGRRRGGDERVKGAAAADGIARARFFGAPFRVGAVLGFSVGVASMWILHATAGRVFSDIVISGTQSAETHGRDAAGEERDASHRVIGADVAESPDGTEIPLAFPSGSRAAAGAGRGRETASGHAMRASDRNGLPLKAHAEGAGAGATTSPVRAQTSKQGESHTGTDERRRSERASAPVGGAPRRSAAAATGLERKPLRAALFAAYKKARYGRAASLGHEMAARFRVDWEAHFVLAEAERKSGEIALSIVTYQKFLELYPANSHADDAAYWAARGLEELGNRQQAREMYRRVLAFSGSNLRDEARKRLEALGP